MHKRRPYKDAISIFTVNGLERIIHRFAANSFGLRVFDAQRVNGLPQPATGSAAKRGIRFDGLTAGDGPPEGQIVEISLAARTFRRITARGLHDLLRNGARGDAGSLVRRADGPRRAAPVRLRRQPPENRRPELDVQLAGTTPRRIWPRISRVRTYPRPPCRQRGRAVPTANGWCAVPATGRGPPGARW